MSAEKSRPLCKGTGEAITNRKEKRMRSNVTPDGVGDAIERIEDLLEFHGMPRNAWSMPFFPGDVGYSARVLLPLGWSHPEATGTFIKAVTVDAVSPSAALELLGDKFAEAINYRVAS
ncbi:hypothetical protein R3Q06_12430 [Rhodococcus erythropolis]|uniref:hypothetical protein n=1 Tax=Rhodococcus erythropolis TaxID=1833 RepID=UPI002949747C|nr:hypothetical protein [Rhodococcus erythropolis]MDV6274310.1 hypothetical protein [Rhodococcus erythropolis]